MKPDIYLVVGVLVVLTGSSPPRGQSIALPSVFTPGDSQSRAGTSGFHDLTRDTVTKVQHPTRNPSNETAIKPDAAAGADSATDSEHATHVVTTSFAMTTSGTLNVSEVVTPQMHSAVPGSLSSKPPAQTTTPPPGTSTTEATSYLTTDPPATFSSQSAHTTTTARPHAEPQPGSLATMGAATTTGHLLTSAAGRSPAGSTHREVPSQLNVGDEDMKGPHFRPSSPLDPLLAGLLSVFIVITALIFIIIFLKFRQRTNHPEFHRLQDLPMDDLMEDTPLSRYTY